MPEEKKKMIPKKMLEISLTKKNKILEKHNTNIRKQIENPNSYNIVSKMLYLFIKRVPEKSQKINRKSD